jgi:putative ATP-dependent endonuclease of OLD family
VKLKSVRLSNVLSFAHQEEMGEATELVFETGGRDGSLHILVGPNGSGKSNLIDVLAQFFNRAMFQAFGLNRHTLSQRAMVGPVQLRESVSSQVQGLTPLSLEKHRDAESSAQQVHFVLELNDNDFGNIEFLSERHAAINRLLTKYASTIPSLDQANSNELRRYGKLEVHLAKNEPAPEFAVSFPQNPPSLIQSYLRNFEAFQHVITIYNDYEKPSDGETWPPLKRTFALLGSQRSYSGFSASVTVDANVGEAQKGINANIRNESTKYGSGREPAVFELVKSKLAYRFFAELYHTGGAKFAEAKIREEELFTSLRDLIRDYLALELQIKVVDFLQHTLELHFYDSRSRRTDPSQLSSGEREILYFIFSLYGYDLRNGVMVIDEPELHLHPQMQRQYLQIIQQLKRELDLQFIIATHSPVFIDKETIANVYRFYLHDGQTKVHHPTIDDSQRMLARILDYTTSSKMFFVDKVILVEGETDECFHRFYLDWLLNNSAEAPGSAASTTCSVEIVNIRGKGERETWTSLLERFGLDVYFIGDWDNINEVLDFDIKLHGDACARAQGGA